MRSYIFWMTILCTTLLACTSQKPTYYSTQSTYKKQSLVAFRENRSLSDTFEEAEASGKMVFIDFYADYCPPCKLMDKEVFTNAQLADYLNRHFISVKIDVTQQQGANLAQLYQVKAFPTLIFTDEKGNMIMKKEGGTSVNTLMYMAEEVRQQLTMN